MPTFSKRRARRGAKEQGCKASLLHPAATGSAGLGTPNAVNELPGPASQFTYDANGNLTGDGQATCVYDQEGDGRVVSATLPGGITVAYRYDPFGRRTSKSVNGTTMVYLHDEQDREVAEYDGASGGVLQHDVYGAGGTVPVTRVAADGVTASYLGLDRLGSVVAVAGSGGALSSQGSYLPFGQGAGPNAGPPPGAGFGYAGYRWDDETGLYHTQTRSYDPRKGRFLQTDPIRQNGGVNLYAYIENDPLNLSDPSGLTGQSATYGYTLLPKGGEPISGTSLGTPTTNSVTTGAAGSSNNIQLAQELLFARPPAFARAPTTPLEELPQGSAGGPGASADFPRALNNQNRQQTPNCYLCDTPTTSERGPDQYNGDHIIAKLQGGNNTPQNLGTTCRTCNLQKGSQTPQQYVPRFYFDPSSGLFLPGSPGA